MLCLLFLISLLNNYFDYGYAVWYFHHLCNLYKYVLTNLVIFGSDYLFKLLLIGDSGVGKSCLLLRFAVSAMHLIQIMFCVLIDIICFMIVSRSFPFPMR